MSNTADLNAARKAKKDREYKSLVLKAFDDFEHADKRGFREHKAAVEREARNKL